MKIDKDMVLAARIVARKVGIEEGMPAILEAAFSALPLDEATRDACAEAVSLISTSSPDDSYSEGFSNGRAAAGYAIRALPVATARPPLNPLVEWPAKGDVIWLADPTSGPHFPTRLHWQGSDCQSEWLAARLLFATEEAALECVERMKLARGCP